MMLAKNQGAILTREQLLIGIWGMDYDGVARTVDTHIRRLREKVGDEIITTKEEWAISLKKKPRKISTTLTLTFTLIMIGSFVIMFILNSLIVPHYYFSKMEQKVTSVMSQLHHNDPSEQHLTELENNNQVTIITQDIDGSSLDDFNEALNVALNRKK